MFAKRLRELREARGFTLDELGELVGGIQKSQIQRWESGAVPNAESVTKLARTFGVTSDYLLGLVDTKSGHLKEEDLSLEEHKLLTALRNGALRQAMELVLDISGKAGSGK